MWHVFTILLRCNKIPPSLRSVVILLQTTKNCFNMLQTTATSWPSLEFFRWGGCCCEVTQASPVLGASPPVRTEQCVNNHHEVFVPHTSRLFMLYGELQPLRGFRRLVTHPREGVSGGSAPGAPAFRPPDSAEQAQPRWLSHGLRPCQPSAGLASPTEERSSSSEHVHPRRFAPQMNMFFVVGTCDGPIMCSSLRSSLLLLVHHMLASPVFVK